MFRWSMSLETGIASIDGHRRHLIEALDDFFLIMDDPLLNQKLVAARTGAVYTCMKVAFAAEDEILKSRGEAGESHIAAHAALLKTYVDMCRKMVPKARNLKQAQQTCLEIYRVIDSGVYPHVKGEALGYKHPVKAAPAAR